jgi:hypothetical protein
MSVSDDRVKDVDQTRWRTGDLKVSSYQCGMCRHQTLDAGDGSRRPSGLRALWDDARAAAGFVSVAVDKAIGQMALVVGRVPE